MIELREAQRRVLGRLSPLEPTEVALAEALGLVLAAPVHAAEPIPPFTNSAMDGFAVRAVDVASAPVHLRVTEDVPAGSVARGSVTAGTAIRIMTGAPLPPGADAVVPVELTDGGGPDGGVKVASGVARGENVRPAGGDVAAGARVLDAGALLQPAHLGVLASVGAATVNVVARPRVGVFSTGDELVALGAPLAPGKIRDSNRYSLLGAVAEAGCAPVDLGIIGDDAALLESRIDAGTSECDVLLTSGGVSVGDYDLVKQVLGRLGEMAFWQVAMRPAKPFAFGFVGRDDPVPLFGLPGNPVSALVAFEQFVRPGLGVLAGRTELFRPIVRTCFLDRYEKGDDAKVHFARVEWRDRNAIPPTVALTGPQASNVLTSVARAVGFAVVDVDRHVVMPGEEVPVELLWQPATRTASEVLGA